jgi:hypothetical protein
MVLRDYMQNVYESGQDGKREERRENSPERWREPIVGADWDQTDPIELADLFRTPDPLFEELFVEEEKRKVDEEERKAEQERRRQQDKDRLRRLKIQKLERKLGNATTSELVQQHPPGARSSGRRGRRPDPPPPPASAEKAKELLAQRSRVLGKLGRKNLRGIDSHNLGYERIVKECGLTIRQLRKIRRELGDL